MTQTRGLDFSKEDRVDAVSYNKILWKGLMGTKPYPFNGGRPLTKDSAQDQTSVGNKKDDDGDGD